MPMSDMNLNRFRQSMRQNPAYGLAAVGGILLLAAVIALTTCRSGRVGPATDVYYFDLDQRRLFAAPGGELLPLATWPGQTPDNETVGAVQAYVFGCGGCKPAQRFIGYLATHNPEVVAALKPQWPENLKRVALNEHAQGRLVRPFDHQANQPAEQWVALQSQQGVMVIQRHLTTHPCQAGQPVIACAP